MNYTDSTEAPIPVLTSYEKATPYIITIDRNSPTVDYSKLKSIGVVGVMIEAGYLFDATGLSVNRYRNPKIDNQVKAALAAKVPHALYSITRAKNIADTNTELYELSFLIRKYPPQIGFWLQLGLTKSVTINNSILNAYRDYLDKLGLKDKIGLYATKSQLSQISWDKHKNSWYLWINKHTNTVEEMDDALSPNFFSLK